MISCVGQPQSSLGTAASCQSANKAGGHHTIFGAGPNVNHRHAVQGIHSRTSQAPKALFQIELRSSTSFGTETRIKPITVNKSSQSVIMNFRISLPSYWGISPSCAPCSRTLTTASSSPPCVPFLQVYLVQETHICKVVFSSGQAQSDDYQVPSKQHGKPSFRRSS